MRAKADSLTPLLRDLYLIVDKEEIPFEILETCLRAAESPSTVILWCILFLCKKLESISFRRVRNGASFEAASASCLWELISKVCYKNVYRFVQTSESARVKNRMQKRYGKSYDDLWRTL